MNLRFIETFLWVARLGSFSAAAERLGATQASVSHRIATLENELGVSLFDRDSRSVILTPAGRQALPKAEEILRAVEAFRMAIADPARLEGAVSLGTNDVIAHSMLSRIMARVRQRYPGVSIDLQIETSAAIERALLDRRIDLALAMGPFQDSRVVNVEFGSFDACWVASPRLGLSGRRLTLADLVGRPILSFPRESAPHRWLLRLFGEAELAPSISYINSLITMVGLVVDGFGVSVLPRAVLGEYVESGALVVLDVSPRFPTFDFHLSYLGLTDSPLVQAVAQMAAETALETGESLGFTPAMARQAP